MLEAHHLCKTIGKKKLVNGVSLVIHPGEIVGLFGPNGAGKTTTFSMVAGLVMPNEGTIFLNKHNVTWMPLYRKARLGLRYLSQESSIFSGLRVADNLYAVLAYTEPASKRKEKLDALLEEFQLTRIAYAYAYTLSGGERRRLEIARALIGNPHYILLDEPLAGVDPKSIDDLALVMTEIAQKGVGIFVTDHNVKDMLTIVTRGYIMYDGTILTQGSPSDIMEDATVERIYLGKRSQGSGRGKK